MAYKKYGDAKNPDDPPNPRELKAMMDDAVKRSKLIQENQETYTVWRVQNASRVLCTVRELAESDGRFTVVSVPKGKARTVRS